MNNMDTPGNVLIKMNALDVIKTYRVPDLQALLDYARLSRQGNKSELFQRCKVLISSNLTPQLLNKINQINLVRINSSRPLPSISSSPRNFPNQHAIVLTPTSSFDNLPLPQQIQYVNLPFYEKIRTIECTNIPVDKKSFLPLRFNLTDYDVNLILKGVAKIFLRIAPTIIHDKQNDVLPPYVFIQCNGHTIINNNIGKTVGSQAHSMAFPTDMTDKIILKSNMHNSLTYFWLQTPNIMSFKNLPKSYTLTIQLVRCISLESLCETILQRELQCQKRDNHDSDIEIEDIGLMATRHRVSLICPITQALIIIPTKSSFCSHLTCFDLRSFLQMNERRLQWTCPLCKKPATYETLHVDKRLKTILSNVPVNCSTVEIDTSSKNLSECQYILDHVKQERTDNGNSTTSSHDSDDDDDDADDEKEQSIHNTSSRSRRQSNESDCVILSSGSESEDNNAIEDNNTKFTNSPVPVSSLSTGPISQTNVNSLRQISIADQSPSTSTVDDENYWQEIANFTNNLISISNNSHENINRKRSNSSSSLLSNNSDHRRRKRSKCSSTNRSQTNDIEIIVLSSSDSSDNDDQLS